MTGFASSWCLRLWWQGHRSTADCVGSTLELWVISAISLKRLDMIVSCEVYMSSTLIKILHSVPLHLDLWSSFFFCPSTIQFPFQERRLQSTLIEMAGLTLLWRCKWHVKSFSSFLRIDCSLQQSRQLGCARKAVQKLSEVYAGTIKKIPWYLWASVGWTFFVKFVAGETNWLRFCLVSTAVYISVFVIDNIMDPQDV